MFIMFLDIGGVPYISYRIMAQKAYFFTFLTFLKHPEGGTSYYARRLPKSRPI